VDFVRQRAKKSSKAFRGSPEHRSFDGFLWGDVRREIFFLMHPIGELSADDWTEKNPAGHDL